MDMIYKTKALRDEAWNMLCNLPAYKAWKALDDAVKAMEAPQGAYRNVLQTFAPTITKSSAPKTTRITQSDVAESVLRNAGEPLPVGRWLERCLERGMNIKGDDPLPNFRSTVSRDKRFYNFTRNGMYFWWLTGVDLPESWKSAEGLDLLDQPSAFSTVNQEGGEADAKATI